jgi:methyl-accepting chemotaxis protein
VSLALTESFSARWSQPEPVPTAAPVPSPQVRVLRGGLGRRLLAAFLIVLALNAVGAVMGVAALTAIGRSAADMVAQSVAGARLVAEAYRLQAINIERYKAVALSSEPQVGATLGAHIATTGAAYEQVLERLQAHLQERAAVQKLQALRAAGTAFLQASAELVRAREYGLTARIEQVFSTRFEPAAAQLLDALDALSKVQQQAIESAAREVASREQLGRAALLIFSLLALLAGLLLALWLQQGVSGAIRLAGRTADRVAGLDLRRDIHGHARDETGLMLGSLAAMQQALRQIAWRLQGLGQQVQRASSELADGHAELSGRTEEAALRLQQTATGLAQMMQRVAASSASAEGTGRQAQEAVLMACDGRRLVAEVSRSMAQMAEGAHRISDITATIEGIAFQTNILALNAAVEAARAGDQGRGFAVVAAEVRQLATRSAVAAQEIKQLAEASMEAVEHGTRLSQQASLAMQQTVEASELTVQTLEQIRAHAQSQHSDGQEISRAMDRLGQMTGQNAALVEQSAAATASLHQQARELAGLVGRFALPTA